MRSELSPPVGSAPCDVFVLGGGPAGSTVAALLAERGHRVVVAERERHPRFHIGESLLPMNLPLFERLGVLPQVDAIGMPKHGAEFNSPHHRNTVTFDFGAAWDKRFPYAYHVPRARFDQILFDNCVAKGAQGIQECRVTRVELLGREGARVSGRLASGERYEWHARFFVDASGRDTFLANQLGIKQRNRRHNSAALYGHFHGATRLAGRDEGNISVFWFEHGWFWFIPMREDLTSVGAVCWPGYLKSRRSDPSAFLLETIALCPPLAQRLRRARMIAPATATGNYSYRAARMHGEGYLLLGDAFAFIDPVFSSGVLFAMQGASLAADAVDAWLRDPRAALPLLNRFERQVQHAIDQFSWFIYRMTSPAMRKLFMGPRNVLRMQEALLSLLAGDVYRGTPIHWSLRAFKALYYLTSTLYARQCLAAWRRRKSALRAARDALAQGEASIS